MSQRRLASRPEERFAFEVMSRTLGVDVVSFDDGSKPSMVDGRFALADGRSGAVEVTTAGSQAMMQSESEVFRRRIDVPDLRWAWHVNVGAGIRMKDLEFHLSVLLSACERQQVVYPDALDPDRTLSRSYVWYHEHDVLIGASKTTSFPGRIYLVPGTGSGGAVPDSLDGFSGWISAQIGQQRFSSDLAKLSASGCDAQHLFLRVRETWLPLQFDYLVAFGHVLPGEPLRPPQGLTGLWLATRWKNPILWWSADGGWQGTAEYD